MSQVCDQHQKKPAAIYVQCIGCELDRLQAEVKRLTKERNDHGPEGRNYTNGQYDELLIGYTTAKYEIGELKAANTSMREELEWYANDANYKLGPNCGLGERARSVLAKIGEGETGYDKPIESP